MEDAKTWFGTQEEFEIPVKSGENARSENQIKKIHWNKPLVHEDGKVIEVEITYNFTAVPMRNAKSLAEIKQRQKNAFFRLILKKNDEGGYSKYLMKYFPEKNNVNQGKFEVNNYSVLSNAFSGDIQMLSWDEELSTGWYVKDGEVKNIYSFENSQGKKKKSYANAALNCTPVMEEICFSYGSDNEQMDCSSGICALPEHTVESQCHTVISYEDPACSDGNDAGGSGWYDGSGGGGGSGSGSGGGLPTVQPLFDDLLEDMPFALLDRDIPCSLIQKWLATANFKPSQSIIDKLNTYTNSYLNQGEIIESDVANIQYIDNAYSKVVNMDYFAVTVSTLPIINGSRATPQQFLTHIRTNINSFTDQSLSTFSPLNWGTINDTNLWNSSNPTGAVVTIDIKGPQNGSVVTSLSSPSKWIFTTIRDPKYGSHPISGNRQFGYTANSNGSYTFYTRGVDRLTSGIESFVQYMSDRTNTTTLSPFSKADNLWKSFQNKVRDFVNQNGGSATKLNPEVLRPNWENVLDVIDGIKPLSTLSKDC